MPARKSPRKITDEAAVNRWAELHGAPPAVSDWNLSLTRAQGRPVRAERYAAGAGAWPYYSTVVKYFGSWAAAIEAAGWHSRPRGNSTAALRAETLEAHNARLPADEQMVPVFGEDGQDRRGADAMRCGHKLREVP